jgi:aspartate/methionine/tyrosine aminotransferase
MTIKIARRGAIRPFIVMDMMRAANERAARGDEVLHLEVGEPGTPPPLPAIHAAQAALEGESLGYTDALGLPSLRARIARHYHDSYRIGIDPRRIVITTGSSGAFLLAFLSAFDVGDRVAVTVPGYPAYRNILTALGVEPVILPTGLESRFQPTVELIEKMGGKLDGLIIASPSNPTGTMLDPEELRVIADYCTDRGIRLISDEIYHGITYGKQAISALVCGNEVIAINSFSKYFSMTGWRLGWMVAPESLVRTIECLAQNLFISPPTLSQRAARAVLDCGDELDRNVERYAENRGLLLEALPRAGFRRLAPAEGAFYLYADISEFSDDSLKFCHRMLAETGIAATPGVDFDPLRGKHYIRFSFAGPREGIIEAGRRLEKWMGQNTIQ